MPHTTARVRAALAGMAIAVSVAGCAGAEPNPASPDSGPDLYDALPQKVELPPAPPIVTTTVTAPTVTTAPTTTSKPKPKSEVKKPAAESAEPGPEWKRVSGDEFNGGLDEDAWNLYDSEGGFGNGLRRPEAISVSDGTLKITARGEVSGGMGHSFGQTYGRWEFRARTDPGRGFGSAILLWPDSEQWPEDGEIDMMEVPTENRERAHFVLHWGEDNNIHGGSVPGNFANWHTFAMEWLPDRITWYVDGKKQYENTDPAAIPTKPMHMTIQLDQGPRKDWLDAPDETTPEEVSLEVDWVRVYSR